MKVNLCKKYLNALLVIIASMGKREPYEPSHRISKLDDSPTRVFKKIGPKTIDFSIGQPDFGTPDHVKEAKIKAIRSDLDSRYAPIEGLPKLRSLIAEDYNEVYGLKLTEKNVFITTSGSMALSLLASSLYEPGDKVVTPNPGFFAYKGHIVLAGASQIPFRISEDKGFRMDVDDFHTLCRTVDPEYLVINSPSNPTGAVQPRSELEEIVDICREHKVGIISDEVYDTMIYNGGKHTCLRELSKDAIVVNSFSKRYGMCGDRMGFIIGTEEQLKAVKRVQTYRNVCAATEPQYGGIAAFEEKELTKKIQAEHRELYQKRRNLTVDGLRDMGMSCHMPEGAFYAFPRYPSTMMSKDFEALLLKEADVNVVAGRGFGRYGEGHIRISYATSEENIKEGLTRMKIFLENLH